MLNVPWGRHGIGWMSSDKTNREAITGETQGAGGARSCGCSYKATTEDRAGRKDNVLRARP